MFHRSDYSDVLQKASIALLIVVVLAAIVFSMHCGPSALHAQAIAANALAHAWNGVVIPGIEEAYREDQQNALNAACPTECSEEVSTQALVRARAKWAAFWPASEIARAAHDAWRAELMHCQQQDAGAETCGPELDRVAVRLGQAIPALRCALRASGHTELDPWGPNGANCE